ncbi:MAG: tRNA (adenosine(37)-N6)-dimethylallyltransferase MiaA [Ferrimicrobium sp.]
MSQESPGLIHREDSLRRIHSLGWVNTPGVMIVGATASGKTELVRRLVGARGDLEAVSIDAMTIYKEMEIGTAMPSRSEREMLNYHLMGHVSVSQDYSLGRYLHDLSPVLAGVGDRDARPIFVGGTALWIRAVANGMGLPPHHVGVRLWLETKIVSEVDEVAGYNLLLALDPRAAAGIDHRNRRRLIRALEVALGEGGRLSVAGDALEPTSPSRYPMVGIAVERSELGERVRRRILDQFDRGWIEEAAILHNRALSRTARSAIGYAELWECLGGSRRWREVVDAIAVRTMRLAKRQMAWFRRDPRIEWVRTLDEGFERVSSLLDDDG